MVMTNTSHFFAWLSIGHKTCILFKNCSSPCGTDHKIFDNLLFLKCIFSLYDYFKRSLPSKSDFKEVLIVYNHEKYSYKRSSVLGGVGFDINCGVRLLRTNLDEKDVKPVKEQLAQVQGKVLLPFDCHLPPWYKFLSLPTPPLLQVSKI